MADGLSTAEIGLSKSSLEAKQSIANGVEGSSKETKTPALKYSEQTIYDSNKGKIDQLMAILNQRQEDGAELNEPQSSLGQPGFDINKKPKRSWLQQIFFSFFEWLKNLFKF